MEDLKALARLRQDTLTVLDQMEDNRNTCLWWLSDLKIFTEESLLVMGRGLAGTELLAVNVGDYDFFQKPVKALRCQLAEDTDAAEKAALQEILDAACDVLDLFRKAEGRLATCFLAMERLQRNGKWGGEQRSGLEKVLVLASLLTQLTRESFYNARGTGVNENFRQRLAGIKGAMEAAGQDAVEWFEGAESGGGCS